MKVSKLDKVVGLGKAILFIAHTVVIQCFTEILFFGEKSNHKKKKIQ